MKQGVRAKKKTEIQLQLSECVQLSMKPFFEGKATPENPVLPGKQAKAAPHILTYCRQSIGLYMRMFDLEKYVLGKICYPPFLTGVIFDRLLQEGAITGSEVNKIGRLWEITAVREEA